MMRSRWYLDTSFDQSLFSKLWPAESHTYLLKLFEYLDASRQPVMSMLPSGVTPAGAAVAASFYFLPGLRQPPEPHCRIALFPGLHFVRQIKEISFQLEDLWRAIQKSRASQHGYAGSVGAFDEIRKRIKDHSDNHGVNFHWVFRCERAWTRHWQKECMDLTPRGYFGRNDPYHPTIISIETEHIDMFSNPNDNFDLLIYCPYFQSRTSEQSDSDLDILLRKIASFSADRKLIVARSPFDYWSRRLESKLGITGKAFVVQVPNSLDSSHRAKSIEIHVVDQIIDAKEAFLLNRSIFNLWKNHQHNRAALNEFKFVLSRLLVGLNPSPKPGELSLDYDLERMFGLAKILGLNDTTPAWPILIEIEKRVKSGNFMTKLKKIAEICQKHEIEIWVTKDDDRGLLQDAIQKAGLNAEIRMANRWMAPGLRRPNRKVVLSRIDRMVDLNLVAYLRADDIVLMSSWEVMIRGGTAMSAWEQSEKWRQASREAGIIPQHNITQADPILDLANYLDNAYSKQAELIHAKAVPPKLEPESWWDHGDTRSLLETEFNREQLLAQTGAGTHPCREISFENGFGMFVREDAELQLISDDEGDGEIVAAAVTSIKPGMTIVLFKDSERSSMFDILMDQLDRSVEYKNDVTLVRSWKQTLRAYVISKDLKVSDLIESLKSRGKVFDPVTVRSWIFGSTMAPMKAEHLTLLVNVLDLKDVDPDSVFNSVKNLRSIARILGKVLNKLIIHKNLEEIEGPVREMLNKAGVDVEELSGAVETRVVTDVSDFLIHIEAANIGKLFKVSGRDAIT